NEPLKTDDVRESYLAFKKLEADLREIRDKVSRLEQICCACEQWNAASADLVCFDLLQHEFAWTAACDSETDNAERIARMEKECSEAAHSSLPRVPKRRGKTRIEPGCLHCSMPAKMARRFSY